MSQVDLGKFSCTSCNREYPWKPDYAGRKVKCKCGAVLTAPAEAPKPTPAAAGDDDDLLGGLYDLAEQEKTAAQTGAVDTGLRCPSCQADLLPGQTVCPDCNFNLKTGLKQRTQKATAATGARPAAPGSGAGNPMLAYAGTTRRSPANAKADAANAMGGSELTELYIPAGLAVLGFIANVIQYGYAGGAWRGMSYAVPAMSLSILFNLVLSFVGIMIVAKLIDLGFGSPGPAVLKLVAICLLGPALASIIGALVGSDSFFVYHMVVALVSLPISAGLFVYLFGVDLDEGFFIGVVIYLVNHWLVVFLLAIFISGIASPIGAIGGGGGGGTSATAEIVAEDRAAAKAMEAPNATEAKAWLGEYAGRMYSGETHGSSVQLVDDLYAAGAKKCVTLSSSGEGYALIVDMTTKADTRKKVLAVINAKETADKVPPSDQTTDQGQRYHTFQFSAGPL